MTRTETRWLVCLFWLILGTACVTRDVRWEAHSAAGREAYQQGDYAEAEKQWTAALKKAEGFEPQDPRLATALNDLAVLYEAQGRYADAEPLFQRALAIREKALRPEHPDVATALEGYAVLLRETGRDVEADRLDARVKIIRAKHAKENPAK